MTQAAELRRAFEAEADRIEVGVRGLVGRLDPPERRRFLAAFSDFLDGLEMIEWDLAREVRRLEPRGPKFCRKGSGGRPRKDARERIPRPLRAGSPKPVCFSAFEWRIVSEEAEFRGTLPARVVREIVREWIARRAPR